MLKKLRNKILISLAAAGIVYLGFTIYADFDQVLKSFQKFNWLLFPLLILFSFCNYFFRFLKWDYYLSVIKVKVKKIDSFAIFMSGLVMSITPGKMGEFLKSYLVREINMTPVSKTLPIIFAERITDFISLLFLALIGAYVYNYGREIVIGVSVFFLLIVIILSNKKFALPLLKLLEKNSFMRKHLSSIHNAYESSYQLLQPAPLLKMSLLSLISWFFECLGYYIILINFGLDVSLLWATFCYGFATIVGAITMLPAGLGVTEGSLTFLLIQKGASKEIAVTSTFIVRIVTLWFAVLVGIISVSLYQRRFVRSDGKDLESIM
ncbi:MAG TPA: lysylphosphatidylglycerol synthase transmembrane domain-containing protein [Ignavibacteriaceae bacterium]|nr:lysylphosphatidylglycerol synthase transmembrane domain-containing protein [Ignavibacteriaceae bacterium]